MKVLVFGATGTAGGGILAACLADPLVREVRAVARRPLGLASHKLRGFTHVDYLDYGAVREAFSGIDACLFALGISIRQVSGEAEYRRITHDFALAAAAELKRSSPDAVLHFVSGRSTDSASRFLWARVKAETERDLQQVADTVCWRPAFIDGTTPTGPRLYRAIRPMFRLLRVSRRLYVTSEDIGRAMIQATLDGRRTGIVENDEIRALAERRREAGTKREA